MAKLPFELKDETVFVAGHREAAAGFPGGGQGRRHRRNNTLYAEFLYDNLAIAEFARLVAATVGYGGEISFDTGRPDAIA